MKRYILFLLVAMLECGIMFSQNNRPLSPMLNISGEFKRDYKDVKKGTACILQRVIKLKKPIGQEESTLQAVVVVGGVQVMAQYIGHSRYIQLPSGTRQCHI
jgi:hypothetical protein